LAQELDPESEALLMLLLVAMVLVVRRSRRSLSPLLFRLRRAQVWIPGQGVDVHPVLLAVGQALADERLGRVRHGRLVGEVDLGGLQDDVLLQDGGLRLVVAERLQRKKRFFWRQIKRKKRMKNIF
jgi:hypothetical protein